MLEDYQRYFAKIPADILQTAVDEWTRTQPWWPTVSDLLAITEPLLIERRNYQWRAEQLALPAKPRTKQETFVPDDDAEKVRGIDMIAKGIAKLKAMPGPA